MKKLIFLWLAAMSLSFMNEIVAQTSDYPGKHWQQYANVADAGFDAEKIAQLKSDFENLSSDGFFVAVDGKVAIAWGDVDRRFMQASVRKSYINAMIGRYAEKGKINPESTLAGLGIDDLQPLSDLEKQATVLDMLAARTGIYHPAAFSPESMIENLPERHQQKPGEKWYYNNWDFNTLVTVFNQETGKDFFEAFYQDIAQPIGMEDFRLIDTYYRYEVDKSKHPAYLFKMSARDMARFGLLYLNEGRWKNEQIVPEDWVVRSTGIITPNEDLHPSYRNLGNYGLLWWIKDIDGTSAYFASGAGTQRIYVVPSLNLVAVHVVNSYQNKGVSGADVHTLMERLLAARSDAPDTDAAVTLFDPKPSVVNPSKVKRKAVAPFLGKYEDNFLGELGIRLEKGKLVLDTRVGYFYLYPETGNIFLVEDMQLKAEFKPGTEAQKQTTEKVFAKNRMLEKVIFYY